MNKQEQILKDIARVMYEKYGEDNITMDTNLKEDTTLDSLDIVELGMEVENKFNISLPDEAQESFTTIGDIVRCVEDRYHPTY
jgi:acyl carrier protein